MHTCKTSWIMGSITCLTVAGCGDVAAPSSFAEAPATATEALRPVSEALAVRAASQVEFNAVEIARLALHRSHSPEVLDFARNMLKEHSHNRKWLRQVTLARGLKIATAMDTSGQTLWGALFKQSGAPFDQAFAEACTGLQQKGLQSIAQLEKVEIHDEVAAWCAAAAATWQDEQVANNALAMP